MPTVNLQTKNLPLEYKDVGEDGVFEGRLSVYDVVDHGGDVVERGAFKKTLKESSGRVHLCWQHELSEPIGVLELRDTDDALQVKGTLNLGVARGLEAYNVLQFNRKFKLKTGLSIGFKIVKDSVENGVRRLKELKLYEGSLVTIPMNSMCYVTEVKAMSDEQKDFAAALQGIQAWAVRHQLLDALAAALEEAFYAGDLARDEREAAVERAIGDFRGAFLSALPTMFDARGIKSITAPTTDRDREFVRDTIKQLSALLVEDSGTRPRAAESQSEAATAPSEPEKLHSFLEQARHRWAAMAAK